jgi:uncharacterized protein (TIGR00369 family)
MTTRERSFTWQDPIELAKAARSLPGQEFLKKIAEGELPAPPIGEMMNFALDRVEDGRVVFTVDPAEYHYNPIGVVHGGVAATLLDSAIGCAVHAKLDAGIFYTTLEIKVNFVRAITKDVGRLYCEASLIHLGNRTATAKGRILDSSQRLYAHGTTTCLIQRP